MVVVAMLLALCACGGGGTTNDAGTGVRVDSKGNLLYKPEDVGELANPVVTGLISPAPDDDWYAQEIGWKETAYGIEFKYDVCAWEEREMKWVSSFVSGDAYDVIHRMNFPTTVVKGLVEPLDDILPVNDERYFEKTAVWKGQTYAVKALAKDYNFYDVSEVYGVWFNQDIFDDYGEKTPLEYWEEGEWTMENFIDVARNLTVDVDRDGVTDVYGITTWVNQMFTIANGASTVTIGGDKGMELTWNDPAYIRGLEYYIEAKDYMGGTNDSMNTFIGGRAAMYVERIQHARHISSSSPDSKVNFESNWVPFPKGENGEGYMGSISTGSEAVAIGKGAKNVEGAKVFICADLCKYDYVSPEGATGMRGVSEEIVERARTCEGKFTDDVYKTVGTLDNQMWNVWIAVEALGAKAAIERFTGPFQNEVDKLLNETVVTEQTPFKSPGTVDFENGDTLFTELFDGILSITEDESEVISGSKSLKLALKAENEYGPVMVTSAEDYSMPIGYNYNISFKAKIVGGVGDAEGTFLVEFRPSADAALKDGETKLTYYNPIDLTSGEVVDVSIDITVDDFYDDLQVVFIGCGSEVELERAVIIDDFTITQIAVE